MSHLQLVLYLHVYECNLIPPVSSCDDVGIDRALVQFPQLSVEAWLTTHTTDTWKYITEEAIYHKTEVWNLIKLCCVFFFSRYWTALTSCIISLFSCKQNVCHKFTMRLHKLNSVAAVSLLTAGVQCSSSYVEHVRISVTAMRKASRPEVPHPLSTTRLSWGSCGRNRTKHFYPSTDGQTETHTDWQAEIRYLEKELQPLCNLHHGFHHLVARKPLKITLTWSNPENILFFIFYFPTLVPCRLILSLPETSEHHRPVKSSQCSRLRLGRCYASVDWTSLRQEVSARNLETEKYKITL